MIEWELRKRSIGEIGNAPGGLSHGAFSFSSLSSSIKFVLVYLITGSLDYLL